MRRGAGVLCALYLSLVVFGAGWIVTPASSERPATCAELLVNGDFESQSAGWTQSSGSGYDLISTFYPHTGSWGAYLGGVDNADDRLSQQIVLPTGAMSITLTAWWAIASEESAGGFDRLTASLLRPDGAVLAELFTIDSGTTVNVWDRAEIDLTPYAGQTVSLRFRAVTDANNLTDFYVDAVSVQACGSPVTMTVTATTTATATPSATLTATSSVTLTATPMLTVTPTPAQLNIYLPIVL